MRKHNFSISGSPKPRWRIACTRICKSAGIAEFGRDHRAVEIGAKPDAVLAQMFEQMLDMLDDQVDGRVLVVAAVRTQEARREIDADQAAGFADRRQLPVGQIARMRADRMRVGMAWRRAARC